MDRQCNGQQKKMSEVIRSQWTDNAMANRKRCQRGNQKPMDRQCNGQQIKMSEVIRSQWTDNAMANR